MHVYKKVIIICAVGALLHLPFPHLGLADTKPANITKNKPQFGSTAEEYLPGAGTNTGTPSNKRLVWIAAGAAAVALALVLGASGGGGGSSSKSETEEPGGVEVEW